MNWDHLYHKAMLNVCGYPRNWKPSPEEFERVRLQFLRDVHPWVSLKADVLGFAVPKYKIYDDGNFDVEYDEESQRLMDECDKGIEEIKQRYADRYPDLPP